jgi:hypothetical protein
MDAMDAKKLLLSLALCFQLASSGLAQQPSLPPPAKVPEQKPVPPPQDPADLDVVKITTNLVQIDAVVTDREGIHVTNLRPDEVEMLENGKPQKISDFSYIKLARTAPAASKPNETRGTLVPGPPKQLRREDVQRTIALVIDDLRMSFDSIRFTKEALRKFLDEQVQPNDLVAIICTAGGTGALQQFTSNKQQLNAAVEKLKWVPRIGNSAQAYVSKTRGPVHVIVANWLLKIPVGGTSADAEVTVVLPSIVEFVMCEYAAAITVPSDLLSTIL